MGTPMLHAAKKSGVCGGTILLGRGTVKNSFLKFLELYDEENEVILMIASRSAAFALMDVLDREFKFSRARHGIAFCTPTRSVIGSKSCQINTSTQSEGTESVMYHVIHVIVDKGNAETAVEAAIKAGATGGTILNARGSGIHETSKLLAMDIEPEKEVVMILCEAEKTDAIAASVNTALALDKPGNGIMFIQDVSRLYGLR